MKKAQKGYKTRKDKYTTSGPRIKTGYTEDGPMVVTQAFQEKGDYNSPYKTRKIVTYNKGSKPTLTKEKFKGEIGTSGSFRNNEILRSKEKTIGKKRATKLLTKYSESSPKAKTGKLVPKKSSVSKRIGSAKRSIGNRSMRKK